MWLQKIKKEENVTIINYVIRCEISFNENGYYLDIISYQTR